MTRTSCIRCLAPTLALVVALLLFGLYFQPHFLMPSLPFIWPGTVLFGCDELGERFGMVGGLLLYWLSAWPCILAYAWVVTRTSNRKYWTSLGVVRFNRPSC